MSKPTAVILDFDGVVVDSERLFLPIWAEVAGRRGKHVPAEVIARTQGIPNRVIAADLFPECSPEERAAIVAEVSAMGRAKMETDLRTVPGVEDFLQRARERHRLALATNSGRPYVRDWTTRFGLAGFFETVVCGDGAFRPKPEPDIYLEVLRILDVPAARCVVVEDSLVGVRAARAAGLRVVGLVGSYPYEELAALTPHVIRGWHEMEPHLPQ